MARMFLLLICVCAVAVGAGVREEERDALVRRGDAVPDFVVKMFDGSELDIKDLRGKVVLVNFWATWCPPCQEEMKRVGKEIVERFKDRDFVYLPISREDTREQVAKFREKHGYSFPMGLDEKREIYSKFAKSGIPRNFLVDGGGRIVYMDLGYDKESFSRLVARIDKQLRAEERGKEALAERD